MSGQILIVDDEMGIRELLSEILTDEGYDVTVAENAAAAQSYRETTQPDLVLLDIWMPDIDGVSLLKHWSASGLLTMPVVMMSGHGTIDTAVEATRIGAVGFLEKPIALKKLLATVMDVLKQHPVNSVATAPAVTTVLDKVISPLEPMLTGSDSDDCIVDMSLPLREARDQFERLYFERLIQQTEGNVTYIAELAEVERTHLYRKLKQLGVKIPKK
ncbi:two-component system response regulator [Sulfuriferula nivalis]|uniref:Two-component system response regulator n=1 Tax=Sulfuriferula nivalis TaxID=2675298 RepID=A0A809SCE6_9PROT|nr:response regulator [Sulfuriferula nivalis]BBO99836.1 two-component system response regulator [Sulfuriferula nivalis]